MSSRQIKAGGAFVELTLRDKIGAGLAAAQAKLEIFSKSVKSLSQKLAGGLRAIGHGLTSVGGAIAAAGAGMMLALGQAVKTFLDVSAEAKTTGRAIDGIDPSKAERLSSAIETLKAVWGAIQFRTGAALAEPLTNILGVLINIGAAAANFIKNNQEVVVAMAAVAAIALVAGLAIAALGGMFILAAAAVAGIGSIIAALATPIGGAVALVAVLAQYVDPMNEELENAQ